MALQEFLGLVMGVLASHHPNGYTVDPVPHLGPAHCRWPIIEMVLANRVAIKIMKAV